MGLRLVAEPLQYFGISRRMTFAPEHRTAMFGILNSRGVPSAGCSFGGGARTTAVSGARLRGLCAFSVGGCPMLETVGDKPA